MDESTSATCLRAVGYLELGMAEECLSELEEVGVPASQIDQLRVAALFELKRWAQAAGICLPKIEDEPDQPIWPIHAAYALRRSGSLAEAEPVLQAALEHHPDHFLICYNLACYACVQGRSGEARNFLSRAMESNRKLVLDMAMKDEDLTDIRQWIRQQSRQAPKT